MNYMSRVGIPVEAFELTANDIIDKVCDYFAIQPNKMLERTRFRKYSQPRYLAMVITRIKMPKKSLRQIGRIYGGYDHATVLHAIKQIANYIEMDEDYRDEVDDLLKHFDIKYIDIFKLVKRRK